MCNLKTKQNKTETNLQKKEIRHWVPEAEGSGRENQRKVVKSYKLPVIR